MHVLNWRLTEVIDREDYEALLDRLGGAGLAQPLSARREARLALQATLSGDQRDLFITYADAATDASAAREEVVSRAGLCFGVAVGTALARFPTLDPGAVVEAASSAVGAVLGTDLSPELARQVAQVALEALALRTP